MSLESSNALAFLHVTSNKTFSLYYIYQSTFQKVLTNIHSRLIDKLLEIKPFIKELECKNQDKLASASTINLHPKVSKISEPYCKVGNYRSAVLDTYIALISAVKEKSGRYDLDGKPLMSEAFSPENGILIVSEDKEVQRGYMFLYMGAVAGIRNDMAHRLGEINSLEAAEWLAFVSALNRVLDACKVDKTKIELYNSLVEPPGSDIQK